MCVLGLQGPVNVPLFPAPQASEILELQSILCFLGFFGFVFIFLLLFFYYEKTQL